MIDKIGFTDDGLVFMMILSTIEGKPVQTVLQFKPQEAVNLAKNIEQASIAAAEVKTHVGNSPNPN